MKTFFCIAMAALSLSSNAHADHTNRPISTVRYNCSLKSENGSQIRGIINRNLSIARLSVQRTVLSGLILGTEFDPANSLAVFLLPLSVEPNQTVSGSIMSIVERFNPAGEINNLPDTRFTPELTELSGAIGSPNIFAKVDLEELANDVIQVDYIFTQGSLKTTATGTCQR